MKLWPEPHAVAFISPLQAYDIIASSVAVDEQSCHSADDFHRMRLIYYFERCARVIDKRFQLRPVNGTYGRVDMTYSEMSRYFAALTTA